MFQILQDFERTSMQLNPIVLIGPGLAIVIVGLFVWLGGLGYRKALVAIVGAVTGWVVGFFVIARSMIAASVLAVVAAITATVLHKMMITILVVALAVVLGFAVGNFVMPYLGLSQQEFPVYSGRATAMSEILSVSESALLMKAYIIDVGDRVQLICIQMSVIVWAIIAVMVVIAILARLYLWNVTSALCCAVLGTILIFAGMVLLLMYKGAMPVTVIDQKASLFAAVFGAMVAFGTIEQLVLCPWFEGRRKKRKEAGDANAPRPKNRWRT